MQTIFKTQRNLLWLVCLLLGASCNVSAQGMPSRTTSIRPGARPRVPPSRARAVTFADSIAQEDADIKEWSGLASFRAPEYEVGRYQLIIQPGENSSALYVMDTATGTILEQDAAFKSGWRVVVPALSPEVFEDALAERDRNMKAAREVYDKMRAEQNAITTLFTTGTLKEQVETADTIMVLQCVETQSYIVYPAEEQRTDIELRVAEILKDNPVPWRGSWRSVRSPLAAADLPKTRRAPSPPPQLVSPKLGKEHPASYYINEDVIRKLAENNEKFVYFSVYSEIFEANFEFIFVKDPLELSESDYYVFVPLTHDVEEFVKDIKAILANKEEP